MALYCALLFLLELGTSFTPQLPSLVADEGPATTTLFPALH